MADNLRARFMSDYDKFRVVNSWVVLGITLILRRMVQVQHLCLCGITGLKMCHSAYSGRNFSFHGISVMEMRHASAVCAHKSFHYGVTSNFD